MPTFSRKGWQRSWSALTGNGLGGWGSSATLSTERSPLGSTARPSESGSREYSHYYHSIVCSPVWKHPCHSSVRSWSTELVPDQELNLEDPSSSSSRSLPQEDPLRGVYNKMSTHTLNSIDVHFTLHSTIKGDRNNTDIFKRPFYFNYAKRNKICFC